MTRTPKTNDLVHKALTNGAWEKLQAFLELHREKMSEETERVLGLLKTQDNHRSSAKKLSPDEKTLLVQALDVASEPPDGTTKEYLDEEDRETCRSLADHIHESQAVFLKRRKEDS